MPATTPKPERNVTVRYVRCDLSAAQKDVLKAWAEEAEWRDLVAWVDSMVVRGHTISIKSMDVGFQVNVTGVRPGSGHDGACLVARASSPTNALYSAWFKDTEVLGGQWPIDNSAENLDF